MKPEGWEVQQTLQEMEAWALAFPWPLARAMVWTKYLTSQCLSISTCQSGEQEPVPQALPSQSQDIKHTKR